MGDAKPKYSIEGLDHGIDRCRINISVLKTAIKAERYTIEQYEKHKRDLIDARRRMAEAVAGVHIEIEE